MSKNTLRKTINFITDWGIDGEGGYIWYPEKYAVLLNKALKSVIPGIEITIKELEDGMVSTVIEDTDQQEPSK